MGKKWLEELQVLLDEDGWRMQRMSEINLPTWVEDPTPVIASVKFFLKQGGDFDLDVERKALAQKREEATKEVLEKVPEDQKGWFTHDASRACPEDGLLQRRTQPLPGSLYPCPHAKVVPWDREEARSGRGD
jgi:hypothetical protein